MIAAHLRQHKLRWDKAVGAIADEQLMAANDEGAGHDNS